MSSTVLGLKTIFSSLVLEHLLDSLGGERLGPLEGHTQSTIPDELQKQDIRTTSGRSKAERAKRIQLT